MAREAMTAEKGRQYWRRTVWLVRTVLILWALLGLALPMAAGPLNQLSFLGVPLGYCLTAQGTLLGFVVLIFWYARHQNRIDEDFDLAED